jgi:hypothetical protein
LTSALAQIYYAVDNTEPNVSDNQDVVPKNEVTKSDKVDDTVIPKKISGANNVPLENNRSRSSPKGLKKETIQLENDGKPHKRKRISYDEDDYPSFNNGQQRGGQRCALCKGNDHDERTCENIRYPNNDEVGGFLFSLFKICMCIYFIIVNLETIQ